MFLLKRQLKRPSDPMNDSAVPVETIANIGDMVIASMGSILVHWVPCEKLNVWHTTSSCQGHVEYSSLRPTEIDAERAEQMRANLWQICLLLYR